MRITVIQILVAGIFASMTYSHELAGQSILDREVTIEAKDKPLKNVLAEIEKLTAVRFGYSPKMIDEKQRVSIRASSLKLAGVLDSLFSPLGISYEVIADRISLYKSPAADDPEAKNDPDDQQYAAEVSGKVTDETGEVLPGVNVLEKGTANGTTTDAAGAYRLRVEDGATLVFSFIGYTTQEVPVNNRTVIDLTLEADIMTLGEVVVVGYGTQKKANLTGSVSSVSSADLENRPITQSSQALAGLAAGVTVSQGSGRPGNDDSSISIRGLGTFSSAGKSPLILVDGLATSINDVDPNNIKSISILKDAASASIYGTRAANGVILIETRRGHTGRMQISYNAYAGWQKVTELPDFLPSWEYATLRNEANANMGQGNAYTDTEIETFRTGSDPDNYPNVPHLKNLLNSGSGFQTYHNLSFTGGDEKNMYLFAMGYLQQDGLVAGNSYDKYNFMLNFDSQLKDNLDLKVNLSANTANTDEPRQYDGEMMRMIAFAVREGPVYAGRKSDGTYGYQDNFSPEAWLASESFVNRKNRYFLGGAELSWEIFDGFTLSGKAGYNFTSYVNNSYASSFVFDEFKTVGPSNLWVSSGENTLVTLQSLARYTKQFGRHDLGILAGFSQEHNRNDWTSAFRDDFPNNSLYELNAGASSNMQSGGSGSEWALRSYLGRINYSFDGKYLFEANARYDGTSRFPEKGRWGLFPSFSAGWRISEEPFMLDNVTWINDLKLRVSWGQLGNQNIGNYPYQNLLSLGQNYSFGGTLASGARVTTLANADITWETTQVTDVGLDLNILGNKLGLVFDYFDKTTTDILYNISASKVLGLNTSEVNAGEVKNTGFEILLNYQAEIRGLKFGISPNFSYVKNEVTRLAGGIQQDISKRLFVGQPLNAIYGYVADGLFVDNDDISSYPSQPYSAEPGFVRYKDISGPDGVPDGQVDATYDRTVIGSVLPKYSFGATITAEYKGFDFSMILHGLGGFEKQMGSYQAFAFYNGGQVQRWQADGRWTEDNPSASAEYPKLTSLNMGSGTIQTSTFWNRSAGFLRFKNIQLGYSISNDWTEKHNITRLRVYASGQNLFSINNFYQGWDPEMNQSTGDNSPFYPITGVYTFGVNVGF